MWLKDGYVYVPSETLIEVLKPGAWAVLEYNYHTKQYTAYIYPDQSGKAFLSKPASLRTAKSRALKMLEAHNLLITE